MVNPASTEVVEKPPKAAPGLEMGNNISANDGDSR